MEVLAVIAILGIIGTIAVVSYAKSIERTKLRAAIETLAADIRQARWMARAGAKTCLIQFFPKDQTYLISGKEQVQLPDGIRFGAAPGVSGKPAQPYEAPPADGVSFDCGSSKNLARFYPTGTVAPTGSVYLTDDTDTMAVTVAITGRPKIWRFVGGKKWIAQ